MTKLDIISDPICPWCYIGKAHLDRALEAAPEHNFDIEWHPFQLNPDMPAGGMDRRLYLETKFGGKEQAVRAYAPVVEHAQSAGLEIAFDKIKTTPNTFNAHRLIYWAGIEGCQTPVVAGLFRAYFKLGTIWAIQQFWCRWVNVAIWTAPSSRNCCHLTPTVTWWPKKKPLADRWA